MYFLPLSFYTKALLGFIIAAVSSSTNVRFKEEDSSRIQLITTLILAGSALDDIFAITFFKSKPLTLIFSLSFIIYAIESHSPLPFSSLLACY